MEEVLRKELYLPLDELQQSWLGMDCEDSHFGRLLCARLGYRDVEAAPWQGSETEGLEREVRLVVKCPPKPMLPDFTRVVISHRLQRKSQQELLLERQIATLDVPYGDSFKLQERWHASCGADGAVAVLRVLTHVHFRGRVGLLSTKIKHHARKKSGKVAALAMDLLMQACSTSAELGQGGGAVAEAPIADSSLQEMYNQLLEENTYLKRRNQQLERDTKKLSGENRLTCKSKTKLVSLITALEAQLAQERHERAAELEVLTEAYNTTIKDLLANGSGGGGHGVGSRQLRGRSVKLGFD